MEDDDGVLLIEAGKHPHSSAAELLEPHKRGVLAVVNPGASSQGAEGPRRGSPGMRAAALAALLAAWEPTGTGVVPIRTGCASACLQASMVPCACCAG